MVRENLAFKYFLTMESLMFFIMAVSTSFYNFFLASEVVFLGAESAKNFWDLVLLALVSFLKVSSLIESSLTPLRSTLVLVDRV